MLPRITGLLLMTYIHSPQHHSAGKWRTADADDWAGAGGMPLTELGLSFLLPHRGSTLPLPFPRVLQKRHCLWTSAKRGSEIFGVKVSQVQAAADFGWADTDGQIRMGYDRLDQRRQCLMMMIVSLGRKGIISGSPLHVRMSTNWKLELKCSFLFCSIISGVLISLVPGCPYPNFEVSPEFFRCWH